MATDNGLTPLMIACKENDMKKVEELLSSDPQVSSSVTDNSGKVAMHYCAEHGDSDLFKQVFDSDPSVMDKRDEDGYTPLTFAVIGGNGPVVDFLLEKGADINNVDAEKHSLIHWATVCGHAEILSKLLKKGSLASTPDLYGAHALHYATQAPVADAQTSTAATSGDGIEILKILLKFGANVNCTDYEERTPLLWAASCGNCSAVQALLEAGADKHSFDKDHLTALHCAASRGHGNVIRTICKTTADIQINARDRNGSSPLFYAAALGHVDAAKALLEHGAMTDLQDKKLRTPTHCAAAKGQLGTLKLLLQHGASFALENYRGDLPIHEAVQAGSQELIEWMLSIAPSYTNATNHDGRTPLHLAAALGHLETCQLLVEKGAHKDALMLSKSAGVTALDLAEEKGHQHVVEYLRSVGAQKSNELTPQSIVEEFKNHMATRKLAVSKSSSSQTKSTAEAQTEDPVKVDQAVTTGHDFSTSMSEDQPEETDGQGKRSKKKDGSKKGQKTKKGHKQEKLAEEADDPGGDERAVDGHESEVTQIPTVEVEEATAVTKVNGVGSSNKENKGSKKKPKSKDSGKKKHGEKSKKDRSEPLDSSRTSAAVSDIASLDEHEIEKRAKNTGEEEKEPNKATKKSKRISENDVSDGANGKKTDAYRTKSEEETLKGYDEGRSDAASEPGGPPAVRHVHCSSRCVHPRHVHGPGSDVTSSGGADISGKLHKLAGPIDRYRADWESSLRSSVQRYAEEKRIFQELANLKRLQIQYGNVQEDVIVRRIMDDFLRGYNVRAGDFQVSSFNSWEKFLYDQLKILYRKEKESLLQTYESKLRNQASLFEQKQAAAIGRRRDIEDRVDRLSRTYGIAPIPMQYSRELPYHVLS